MGLRPSLRRRYKQRRLDPELNITPFIDILVCLILFLLVTAVLGRASILNLYLPTEEESATISQPEQPTLIPTLAITSQGFILSKRPGSVERIPKKEGNFDFERLRQILIGLRAEAGYSNNMILLPEGRLRYQALITTMDTVREYREAGQPKALFPVISVGEFKESADASGKP